MTTETALDNKIQQLKREIRLAYFMIVVSCIVILAVRVGYTKLAVSHEQATGKKMLRVIPENPVTRILYLAEPQKTITDPWNN